MNTSQDIQYKVYQFNTDIIVKGLLTTKIDGNFIDYIAASPPDYRSSFSGSALPYANELQAFEMTPNKGRVSLKENNSFDFKLSTPNSYVDGFTENIIKPFVLIKYVTKGIINNIYIDLPNEIPFRSITHSIDRDSLFYDNKQLPVRTQEQILKDSSYPTNNDIKSFWGLKPAC
jgi:hypothetical protein